MRKFIYPYSVLLFLLFATCKESYIPPVISTGNSYLVVEGFINNGADTTRINLTHTFKLADTAVVVPELHAQVFVEGKSGGAYPLAEQGKGLYIAPGLSLSPAQQYRLHIRTNAGKEYASDFVDLKASPPIDSINWVSDNKGFQLYVNTHDPQNASRYYRWDIAETWEFHAVYQSILKYENGLILPRFPDTIYTCWQNNIPSTILLASSAKLAQDVIYRFPLTLLPPNSWKISVRYSLLLKQYVLTPEAYNFWQQLQKNSEQVGSIFSAQPSEARGNIHNLADSSEQVIGYISAGTMRQQRIFITPYDIPDWRLSFYSDGCEEQNIPQDSLKYFLEDGGALPLEVASNVGGYFRYWISGKYCADCTQVGTNKKPYFWP
jgi:hypothetical protein